jgi:TM2 domain-containing membrane protein YozV
MNKVGTAYVLWLGGLLGLAGLHRIYNGEVRTGILWFCTWGLFGVGQIADLVLIPRMVETHNEKLNDRFSQLHADPTLSARIELVSMPNQSEFGSLKSSTTLEPSKYPLSQNSAIVKLLKAAEARDGRLSVTQGVMATGLGFIEVEALLKEMLKSGYVDIGNDPETGVVTYEFKELQ